MLAFGGGPERAASLVQHYDVGRPFYDLHAKPELTPDEYAAVIERYRGHPDVRAILHRVAPHCLRGEPGKGFQV